MKNKSEQQFTLEAEDPRQSEALMVTEPTPLSLLQQGIAKGISIEQLERLQAMYERWEANEAKKRFVEAMNEFKKNPPQILKNKQVAFKDVKYSYAALDQVCDAVTEGLSKVGISHRWRMEQKDAVIIVTCILTHENGHSEETTLYGNPDTSGSKNAIQAIGSTVTYLQRYTLLAATGLAASADDDGRSTQAAPIGGMEEGRFDECVQWISGCREVDELRRVFKQVYQEARDLNDQAAMKAFISAKDARLKEIQ